MDLYRTTLVGLGLLLCASASSAGTLGLHLGSQHYPAKNFNNLNPGAYYISDDGWTVGTYYNSVRKQSVYARKFLGLRTLPSASWLNHRVLSPRAAHGSARAWPLVLAFA